MSRALVTGALLCVLWPASALAGDAGRPPPPPPASEEDREVIENLDLLQAMDDARDLDLLLELNQDREGEGE